MLMQEMPRDSLLRMHLRLLRLRAAALPKMPTKARTRSPRKVLERKAAALAAPPWLWSHLRKREAAAAA
jgi:hypothetical protein